MSVTVHFANADTEFEMATSTTSPFEKTWQRQSLCLQLQFLPLLYANQEDMVAVTALPSERDLHKLASSYWGRNGLPRLILLSEQDPCLKGAHCLSWGPSLRIKDWALKRQVQYDLPLWQIVQTVNSKAFSQRYSVLEDSTLITHESQLQNWLEKVKGPKILKTCFGVAGAGHLHLKDGVHHAKLLSFCQREWSQKRPIVAEPWLERVLDFSTQWLIAQDGSFYDLGATLFETDAKGQYHGTWAGDEKELFGIHLKALQEHRAFVKPLLKEMAELGFFGHVGIDALLYLESGAVKLYPVVEINARQTMSLVALKLQQKHCPTQFLRLSFTTQPSTDSLLPQELVHQGEKVHFHRYLTLKSTEQFHLLHIP